MDTTQPAPTATPTTTPDVTAVVAEVWRDVLGVEISADADFFTLGGHSLLAMEVIARLRQRLDVAVRVRLLLEHPVFADFAAQVASVADAPTREPRRH